MPGDDDYHTPGGGLKLKGSKPSGIKKKKKKPSASTPSRDKELQKVAAGEESGASSSKQPEDNTDDIDLRDLEDRDPRDGKTAAERAAEETRRKRLADRLAREGTKTHKERVEELNKYLSNLSEHHDMPRIGPG